MDRRYPDGVGRRNRFEKMDSKTSAVTYVRGRLSFWGILPVACRTSGRHAHAGKTLAVERADAGSQGAGTLRMLGPRKMDRGSGDSCNDVFGTDGLRRRGGLDGMVLWHFFACGLLMLRHQRSHAHFCQLVSAMAFLWPGLLFLVRMVQGALPGGQSRASFA